MGKSIQELLQEQESLAKDTATDGRKIKKFLKIAIPIFVIEILTIVSLLVYFVILPKNTLTITTNMSNVVVYVNGDDKDKIKLETPKSKQENYAYTFNLEIFIPESGSYTVSFKAKCDDAKSIKINCVGAIIEANGVYSRTVPGGEKTKLLSGITMISDEKPKDFDVVIEITITKKNV